MMIFRILRALLTLLLLVTPLAAAAGVPQARLALVIGNAAYKAGTLGTPANDAALVAEALRVQGFDVTGSRDLDAKGLRQAFEQFRSKVGVSGPGSVIVIYFAGLGLQLEGENYLIPVDAVPTQTSDIRLDGVQLSSLIRSFAELGPKAAFVILDAARNDPFFIADGPLAGGFAWVEPEVNFLVALNAAPGTIASNNDSGFSPYAVALAEMFRQDGLSSGDLFARVRLRVNEATNGGQVPWQNAKLQNPFVFAERASDAPQRTDRPELTRPFRTQPMRTLSAGDAYFTALTRDTFDGYSEFLAEYWKDPMTSRVRALLAGRREVLTWHRSTRTNTANAYWTYLERYPRGPHLADAQRWLTRAGAAIVPPSNFARMECDVPAPLPDERQYVERAALNFGDTDLAFEAVPPVPNYFLSAPTPEPRRIAGPGGRAGDHDLPALSPASTAGPGMRVAAPLLPKQAELPNGVPAEAGNTANSTSTVPTAARPVSPNLIAGATTTVPAAPTVAGVPWIIDGPAYQSVPASASADTQRQPILHSLPSPSSGMPLSDTHDQPPSERPGLVQPAPDQSTPALPLATIPLPSPRPRQRGSQTVRQAVRAPGLSAPRAGAAVVSGGRATVANAPGPAPQLSLRPSLEAPTRAIPPRPVNSGQVVIRTIPRTRPNVSAADPSGQPAKKPAADTLSQKPAAVLPDN